MPDVNTTTKRQQRSLLQILLSTGFLANLSTATILYVNSSYLETLVPEKWVGVVFALAYTLTFLLIQNYAKIIRKWLNHQIVLTIFGIEIIALFLMAAAIHPFVSLSAFVLLIMGFNVAVINYDIFLEAVSNKNNEGKVRGMFWTAANLGILIGPFLSGLLLARFSFSAAYFFSGLLLIPVWLMIFFAYRNEKQAHFKVHHNIVDSVKKIHANKNLRGIYLIAFGLYLFYSWMVIYTPIYLLEIGFNWEQIGSIFTVMLVPFVLIEYPAGWLADRYLGETEMLTLGFALAGLAVVLLLMVSSFWGVMAVLVLSRVGASLIEIMRDVYFYKQVNEDDLDLIDLFRNTRSIANIIGPILASIVLAIGFGLPTIFVILAIFLFIMTIIPFTIEDTL